MYIGKSFDIGRIWSSRICIHIHLHIQKPIQENKCKQKAIKEKEKRDAKKMRSLTGLEYLLIGIIISLGIGAFVAIAENNNNKIYLHISLQNNRNYIESLLQYEPNNHLLEKELNNTENQISQMEGFN